MAVNKQLALALTLKSACGKRGSVNRHALSLNGTSTDAGAVGGTANPVHSSSHAAAGASSWTLYQSDVLEVYDRWPTPSTIVSDGAYGIGGFHGDPRTLHGLVKWYEPHVEAWSRKAKPATTLWLWNTEIGWATVHPLLNSHDWEYVQGIIWDKGIPHIAGNVNGDTIRQFPVVTEVCVFYRRKLRLPTAQGMMLSLIHI